MRLCRYRVNGHAAAAFYCDDFVVPLDGAAEAYAQFTGRSLTLPTTDNLLSFLPPDGPASIDAATLAAWVGSNTLELPTELRLPIHDVQLLVPILRPNKILLLAGNYAAHIEEGGGRAAERAETFPWVFLKPPTTTLTDPGRPVVIPAVSPQHIDWELELAVVIGRRAKGVSEVEALDYVAGYTIINDISNRKFRPNPQRKTRERDAFFDWMHGKWHDSFCPCGPCIVSADAMPDPQTLPMELRVNGAVKQKATTALQIFPVAAVIEFISALLTLEPGDIISTGTPSGVGHSKGEYLRPGDHIEAEIGGIGRLLSPVIAEDVG